MDPRRLLPALSAVACACLVLTLGVGWVRSGPDASPSSGPAAGPAGAAPGSPPPPREGGPAGVLAAWDRERARAWAAGDVAALRALYVDGSRAGAADVRMLRAWLARGLRVEGLTTQVLALDVVDRGPHRLVLRVTDRVVGARAVGTGTGTRPLPVARPAERQVVLRRVAGEWRVVEATGGADGQASAAASTSRTSSSSKS